MKATGVVRRIDDLGRIVIPKEIRQVLRIKEGDPIEIFTGREGEVILKKYSPIGELSEFATDYAETLAKTTGHIACITDKDSVIAVSGGARKEYLEQSISKVLEQLMDDKEIYTSNQNNDISLPITKNDNQERKFNSQVIYPIISQGDVIGSVILLSKEQNKKMNETEVKVAQSAAGFLSSQMEIQKAGFLPLFFVIKNNVENFLFFAKTSIISLLEIITKRVIICLLNYKRGVIG